MPRCAGTPIAKEIRAHAKAMYLAGAHADEICSSLGLNKGTVRVWGTRGKWVAEKDALNAKVVAKIAGRVDRLKGVEVDKHQARINDLVDRKLDILDRLEVRKVSDLVPLANALKTFDDVKRRNLGLDSEAPGSTSFHLHANTDNGWSVPGKVLDVKVESQGDPNNTSDGMPDQIDSSVDAE